jgi:hypothetical protein
MLMPWLKLASWLFYQLEPVQVSKAFCALFWLPAAGSSFLCTYLQQARNTRLIHSEDMDS